MNMSRRILSIPIVIMSVLFLTACGTDKKEFDATGTFEATETTVFAEQSGALLTFGVNEGDSIAIATEVGVIDTIQTKCVWKAQFLRCSGRSSDDHCEW